MEATKQFTWRGMVFELEHSGEAEPDVGLSESHEYVCKLDADAYVTVWTHAPGTWVAELHRSLDTEPIAASTGANTDEALRHLLFGVAGVKNVIAEFERRMLT
jgi:hypothetical protein